MVNILKCLILGSTKPHLRAVRVVVRNMKEKPKMYVIRKYVKATSVLDAVKKDKTTAVHEVYVDDKWQDKHLAEAIGFHDYRDNEE